MENKLRDGLAVVLRCSAHFIPPQTRLFFAGLRGAIAFALSLHLEFENEKRHVIVTSTLIIVLFTVLILGGSTMPMMKVRTSSGLGA